MSMPVGIMVGRKDSPSFSHPKSQGSSIGGMPVTLAFHEQAIKCALLIFNSRASSVGGRLFKVGGFAVFFAPSVLLIHILFRFLDELMLG